MMAKASRLAFLSALALTCIDQASAGLTHLAEPALHSAAPVPVLNQPNWRRFTSAVGRFSLLLPATPISRTRRLHTEDALLQQFICRLGSKTYILQYVDGPAQTALLSPEEILTIKDDALLKVSSATLISKRHLTLGRYPGHEIVVIRANGTQETQRTYLAGTRAYTLALVQSHPQADPDTAHVDAVDADKFLNSFTLLPPALTPK